ncbi:unnamed protein product [Rotaria sp. Silwood2]|nr:unnamed protein product [Rotaria sp. Silwood2]CAF3309774.1 unnamed protein product [Rotaria sp. Silwood2]CAF4128117.1 unnamed protein product [Rotaria sp. Silwood2]
MPLSNDTSTIVRHNGLSQDAQGRWFELLSPTQILTGQQQNLENNKKQQKKKKCHGNRKQQHQRRRLRRQQMKQNNNPTNHIQQDILIVIDDTDDNPEEDGQEQEQQIQEGTKNSQHRLGLENKRKRQEINKDDIHISQSFSELSISQMNPKKTKSTIEDQQSEKEVLNLVNGDTNEQQQQQQQQQEDNDLISANCVQRFKPRYLRVSDKI